MGKRGKPAPLGNQYGVKLKDKEIRQEAYRQYCEHIANGYPIQAFFFMHKEHSVCWATMEKYIRDETEFDPNLLREAKAKRYLKWFKRGENLVDGQIKGNPSPQTWQVIMRNMFKEYGWDVEKDPTLHQRTSADEILDKMNGNN